MAELGRCDTRPPVPLGATAAVAAAPSAAARYVATKDSLPATTDARTGLQRSARMSVEVALAPRDEAGLNAALKALYTKGSGRYEHWLAKRQFDARYAPAREPGHAPR